MNTNTGIAESAVAASPQQGSNVTTSLAAYSPTACEQLEAKLLQLYAKAQNRHQLLTGCYTLCVSLLAAVAPLADVFLRKWTPASPSTLTILGYLLAIVAAGVICEPLILGQRKRRLFAEMQQLLEANPPQEGWQPSNKLCYLLLTLKDVYGTSLGVWDRHADSHHRMIDQTVTNISKAKKQIRVGRAELEQLRPALD